jgi:DNA repair protein RecO (recombination protein O)
MAEIKITALIIDRYDFNEYDVIVKAISENKVFSFLAKGIRKSTSKNAHALKLLDLSELEIFEARLKNKISKLKRADLVTQNFDLNNYTNNNYLILIKYLKNLTTTSPKFFSELLKMLPLFKTEEIAYARNYLLNKLLKVMGLAVSHNACVECGLQINICDFNFYSGGLLCNLHKTKDLPLDLLKAYVNLGNDYDIYSKTTSSRNNKLIYENLISYLNENTY